MSHPRAITYRPLDDCTPAGKNPKGHVLHEIAAAIARLGFLDGPIEDGRTGKLIAGHGRIEALKLMRDRGDEAPDGIQVRRGGWFVGVQTGWRSRNNREADAALIAVNELPMRGGWEHRDMLGDMLAAIAATPAGLTGVGFDSPNLDAMAAALPQGPPPDMLTRPADEPTVANQYGVIVMCPDEHAQEQVYNRLTAEGLDCKVVVV